MADTMDVDPPTTSEPKGKTREDGKLDKKRFEVKKVRRYGHRLLDFVLTCISGILAHPLYEW